MFSEILRKFEYRILCFGVNEATYFASVRKKPGKSGLGEQNLSAVPRGVRDSGKK
jgi:hypothetical protein